MAPGKVVALNIQRSSKKALGKKDKYNRLGEGYLKRIFESTTSRFVDDDQETILRDTIAEAYPEYVGLIDDYLQNGLAGCEGCFEDDLDLIDDFINYAEYVLSE